MPVVRLEDASSIVVQGHAKRIQAAIEAVRRVVKVNGPRLVQVAVDETSPPPVDRGTYRRSFRYEDIPKGAQITNSVPYASVIEGGRRPGARMPPIDAIKSWVLRKGLVKNERTGMTVRKAKEGSAIDAQARSIAWVIARKIAQRGLPPKGVLKRALVKLKRECLDAIKKVGL